MILLQPSVEIVERAESLDVEAYNGNSFMRGRGNRVGYLGELVVIDELDRMGFKIRHINAPDFDLIVNRQTIDVKTKSQTKDYTPKPHYEASIAVTSTHQQCDLYIFVRAWDFQKVWICGWIEKQSYFDKARFLRKGTQDGDNGYEVKSDCYNLPYGELNSLSSFPG